MPLRVRLWYGGRSYEANDGCAAASAKRYIRFCDPERVLGSHKQMYRRRDERPQGRERILLQMTVDDRIVELGGGSRRRVASERERDVSRRSAWPVCHFVTKSLTFDSSRIGILQLLGQDMKMIPFVGRDRRQLSAVSLCLFLLILACANNALAERWYLSCKGSTLDYDSRLPAAYTVHNELGVCQFEVGMQPTSSGPDPTEPLEKAALALQKASATADLNGQEKILRADYAPAVVALIATRVEKEAFALAGGKEMAGRVREAISLLTSCAQAAVTGKFFKEMVGPLSLECEQKEQSFRLSVWEGAISFELIAPLG